jgi:two-component system, OmpR family, response regulator
MVRGARYRDDSGMTQKLLIVDDSELVRTRLGALLASVDGVVVTLAATLLDALEDAVRDQPELIVLDLHLPECNAIRAIPHFKRLLPSVRIAVLTNAAHVFNRNASMEAGADWFFDKSTEFDALVDMVRQQSIVHPSAL